MTRVMHYSPAFASAQLTMFEGTAYLTPILGAWLADAAWGRYKTILVFSIIYMVVRHPLVLWNWQACIGHPLSQCLAWRQFRTYVTLFHTLVVQCSRPQFCWWQARGSRAGCCRAEKPQTRYPQSLVVLVAGAWLPGWV